MDLPRDLLAKLQAAAEEHNDDTGEAVACALESLQADERWPQWCEVLICQGIQKTMYDIWHKTNRSVRAASVARPKVFAGAAVNDVAMQSYLDTYRIGGYLLGRIEGRQLPALIARETAIAKGSLFNAELCKELSERVGDDQTVGEVLTDADIDDLFKRLRGRKVEIDTWGGEAMSVTERKRAAQPSNA